jgi:predicted small metal-binding protein
MCDPRPVVRAFLVGAGGASGGRGLKRITCVCGKVIEGDDDEELLARAEEHVAADHPDLVGQVSREDILARAEEI